MIAAIKRWFTEEPPTNYERTFHNERFQYELGRLRASNEGFREAMEQVYRHSNEIEVVKIAAKALGKPRP